MVWGGVCTRMSEGALSLTRKGFVFDLGTEIEKDWDSWVDFAFPHAAIVWRLHFSAIMHNCLWYALSFPNIHAEFYRHI